VVIFLRVAAAPGTADSTDAKAPSATS